ncbi:MAG: hypothetical protein J7K08_01030 [Thermoplasmata archaeon]|nr:hypothetical protein [Thermoplasmata archaeon]
MKRLLYTSTSLYPHAVVNSYWAILRVGFHPQEVVLLLTEGFERQPEEVIPAMEALSEYETGSTPHFRVIDIRDVDYTALPERLKDIFTEGAKGAETALDVSPGRKYLVVPAVMAAREAGVKHIFYTFIRDLSWGDVPLPLKPFTTYHVYDLLWRRDDA